MKNKTKTTTPIAFAFEDTAVRIIPNADNPLFVAKDVAVALGHENPERAVRKFCKGGPKWSPLATNGGKQEIRVIDEPDVYRLIFGSKLESAKRFQDWVFEEVLPSIRKTGSYSPVSKTYETNHQHALRLKLLQALDKAESTPMRESIYQSLSAVSQSLNLPLLPLDDFNNAGVPLSVLEKAGDICQRFWASYDTLTSSEGKDLNHSSDARFIAVQLSEIIALSEEYEIDIPERMELIRYLPYSLRPEFVHRKCIISHIRRNKHGKGKTVRCFVFKAV